MISKLYLSIAMLVAVPLVAMDEGEENEIVKVDPNNIQLNNIQLTLPTVNKEGKDDIVYAAVVDSHGNDVHILDVIDKFDCGTEYTSSKIKLICDMFGYTVKAVSEIEKVDSE